VKPTFLTALTLLAALVWTAALIVDPYPLEPAPSVLVGFGLLTTATVGVVGMVVVGGRWAHRLALVSLAITVVVGVIREADVLWIVGVISTAVALLALLSPPVLATIRKLPSAAGPPPRAVLPPLMLLVTPALLGFAGNQAQPIPLLLVGLSAPSAAFLFARVLPGGLIAIRIVWPSLALAMSPLLGWWAGGLAVAVAVTVAFLAWDSSVRAAYHPPREVGSTFPVPPELTPQDIRDAAGIDEKGRPKK
jgi:hypothetical protein